jgi:membrane associated rhomboid family serine protease
MSHEYPEPSHIREDTRRLRHAFLISVSFAAVLWWVGMLETLARVDLVEYGIYPRKLSGLLGILTAPFIHGSLGHLFSNTVPIVVLGTTLLYGYPKSARVVIPALFLGTGLGVWLFGRASYHIGASGLTFGMMFFVFTIGMLRWDRRAIGLSLVVFFLYGGMIWGVFPTEPNVSYESHLAGALVGVALAFLLRRLDPPPPVKRYSWEIEPEAPVAEVEPGVPAAEADPEASAAGAPHDSDPSRADSDRTRLGAPHIRG